MIEVFPWRCPDLLTAQMALKGVERAESDSEDEEGRGHHSNGVAMTPQDPLSPASVKEFRERAL